MGAIYNNVMQNAVVANVGVDLLRNDKSSVKKDRDSNLFQTTKTSTAKQVKDSAQAGVLELEFTDLFGDLFQTEDAVRQGPVHQEQADTEFADLIQTLASQTPEEKAQTRSTLAPELYKALDTTRAASPELTALTVELLRDEPEFKKLMSASSSEQQLQLNELKLMDIIINGNLDNPQVMADAQDIYRAVAQSYYLQEAQVSNS